MNEKQDMATISMFQRLVISFVIILFLAHCGKEEENASNIKNKETVSKRTSPDLSQAIKLRLEGKPDEAVKILSTINQSEPNLPEVLTQLARALFEAKKFELAAFRFDQANSSLKDSPLFKEAGLSYEYAEDFASAIDRYTNHLSRNDGDSQIWLRLARLLVLEGKNTAALNAFSKGSDQSTYHDCVSMANLYYEKKLLPQAEHWFRQASIKGQQSSPLPMIGLLRIKLLKKEEEVAESLILEIEKSFPGSIEETDLDKETANLLKKRNLVKLLQVGTVSSEMSVSEIANFLLNPSSNIKQEKVLANSKIPPLQTTEGPEQDALVKFEDNNNSAPESLASAFAAPSGSSDDTIQETSSLEAAKEAYLSRRYQDCLVLARKFINKDNTNPEAWRLCSQAHYQMGEVKEAEMTILEAVRHAPKNLEIRLDYLRMARETLDPKRYLEELERARESFPDSIDLIWELARRYHLVERMPVTASILYRQILDLTSEQDELHKKTQMELLKLREP